MDAGTAEKAAERGWAHNEAGASFCNHCASSCQDPEVTEITVEEVDGQRCRIEWDDGTCVEGGGELDVEVKPLSEIAPGLVAQLSECIAAECQRHIEPGLLEQIQDTLCNEARQIIDHYIEDADSMQLDSAQVPTPAPVPSYEKTGFRSDEE